MNECRQTAEQLTPYVDGVLKPDERAQVERHLDLCGTCRVAARQVEGARLVLRARAVHLAQTPLPPGLRTRCEALARVQVRRTSSWWYGRLAPALAIAVMLLATGIALFSLATRRSDLLLAQQLTVDHMKCFRLFASGDSRAIDAHNAETTLHNRYGWNVRVPPSSPKDRLALVGARRCLYASGPIPHVMYRANGEDMSLFVLEGEGRRSADIVTLGHRSRIWSEGTTTYVLVSARGNGDLGGPSRYMMQQLH